MEITSADKTYIEKELSEFSPDFPTKFLSSPLPPPLLSFRPPALLCQFNHTCIALALALPPNATQNHPVCSPTLLPRWNPGGRWVPCQFPLQPFFAAVRSYPSVSNKPYERNLQIQDFNGTSKHKEKLHVTLKKTKKRMMENNQCFELLYLGYIKSLMMIRIGKLLVSRKIPNSRLCQHFFLKEKNPKTFFQANTLNLCL